MSNPVLPWWKPVVGALFVGSLICLVRFGLGDLPSNPRIAIIAGAAATNTFAFAVFVRKLRASERNRNFRS